MTRRPNYKKEVEMGHVYLVRSDDTGRYKIGHSKDVRKRLKGIATGGGVDLTLIGLARGTTDLEAQMHQVFADRRKKGEWFEFADDTEATQSFIMAANTLSGETPAQRQRREASNAKRRALGLRPDYLAMVHPHPDAADIGLIKAMSA